MAIETYTNTELDTLASALLWTGGLHSAMGNLLDVTKYRQDVDLVGCLNFMPTEPAAEILEASIMGLAEIQDRITVILGAFEHALNVCCERIAEEDEASPVSDEFTRIMGAEFGGDAKKNGGA
jgi:hypothetical protein